MRFVSTRGGTDPVTLSDAITEGIAGDGGLFVPAALPALSWSDFPPSVSLATLAQLLIAPFAAGDPLGDDLAAVCREAFSFPAPLVPLERARGDASVLELFHGPTCAFKDFGARFLAAALERLHGGGGRKVTILVATSGDTGGAVAAAFHRRPWIDVVLLYPDGLVSPRQAQQLSCWGETSGRLRSAVRSTTVSGSSRRPSRIPRWRPPTGSRRPTASTSDGCFRRWSTTPRRAWRSGIASSARPTSSCRRAISATPPPASGHGRRGCRSATSCSRRTRTVPSPNSSTPARGSPARASRPSPQRWTSATRPTWSGCAHSMRTNPAGTSGRSS